MSLSLFYRVLGLYGFNQLRSWKKGGALYLEVMRSKKRCGACSAWKVKRKLSLRVQERLWQLLRINHPIFIAYVLKEELRRLWKMPSREKAKKFLKVEGINNRIKVIKRRAYGYRDLVYFKLKIYNLHATRYPLL